jgi:hypothetical protein
MSAFGRCVMTAIVSCTALLASGQDPVATAVPVPMVNGVPYTVIYQPAFSDTTVQFLSRDLVCRCAYGDENPWLEWYKADWSRIRKCECARELYQLELVWDDFFDRGTYQPKEVVHDVRSTMTRDSDSTFTYVELAPEDKSTSLEAKTFLFNTGLVTQSDSLYAEDYDSRAFKLTVEKIVELRRIPNRR